MSDFGLVGYVCYGLTYAYFATGIVETVGREEFFRVREIPAYVVGYFSLSPGGMLASYLLVCLFIQTVLRGVDLDQVGSAASIWRAGEDQYQVRGAYYLSGYKLGHGLDNE